ncbi:MAG: histidine kinase dimerization/phospho-acceptor domain-containing protein, partial [Alphaproteobacteria bacterium]
MSERGQPRTIPKRWFFLWAAVAAPGAGVLALLFLLHQIELWPTILGSALWAAALFFIVRAYLADFDAVIAYIGDLARGRQPAVPETQALSASDEILSAVEALNRAHVRRTAQLETLAEANVTILDSIPDPLLLLSNTRRIRQANRAARALATTNPVGQDLAAVIRDPVLLEEVDIALETKTDRETLFTFSYPRLQHFLVRIIPLPRATEDGTTLIVSLHDLTATKQLEQTRVDFIANVSHELRTPLATLVGFIETLQGPAK